MKLDVRIKSRASLKVQGRGRTSPQKMIGRKTLKVTTLEKKTIDQKGGGAAKKNQTLMEKGLLSYKTPILEID